MRPRIGVAPCFFHADPQRPVFKGKTLLYAEQSLVHWLQRAGALPFLLPTPDGGVSAADLLGEMDGLVLQGGSDVAPESYGEQPLQAEWCGDRVRDLYEMELIRLALDSSLPVLGVCRGMQILNVALGGTLYQDCQTQHPDRRVHRDWNVYDQLSHDVRIEPGSWLAEMYPGRGGGTVNTIHHQAVRDVAPDLLVEAVSADDGLVEAVRRRGEPFVYAVQWHPEFHDPADTRLLDGRPIVARFVAEAAARRGAAAHTA